MKFFTLCLCCFFSFSLAAEEPAQAVTITGLSIEGLRRTKLFVVEKPLQKFLGRDAAALDVNEVYAVVKDTGVLEPVSVDVVDDDEGNGKKLKIIVREKWTFFPIPFFTADGTNSWFAGGAVMDSNAFGIKDSFMVMAGYGSDLWMAGFSYAHRPSGAGAWGWRVGGMFFSRESSAVDQSGQRVLRRFSSYSVNPSAGLSYSLTDWLTPSLTVAYTYITLKDTENAFNAPPEGVQALTLTPQVRARRSAWDGFFLSEQSVTVRYNYIALLGSSAYNDNIQTVTLNGVLQHSLVPGLRLVARSGVVFATPGPPFFESGPQAAGVSILPSQYAARDFAGLSAGLEKYLYRFSFGTLSVAASYQAVYSAGDLFEGPQFDHGLSAALLLYFTRLALPGMGLSYSYNVDKGVPLYGFNAGMSF